MTRRPRTRLTRSGLAAIGLAIVAIATGRTFGVAEMYVVAAALVAVLIVGRVAVGWSGLPLTVERWVHPPVVTVGDVGRVDLSIENPRRRRSARITMTEPVGRSETARLTVAPLAGGRRVEASYRVPARHRGVLTLGPLELRRTDLVGVATISTIAAPEFEITVAPRAHELTMPDLGRGVLGRHLLVQAQRLGTGEFHSLRDYVVGDEPRLIDWRASARSDDLKIRQNTTEGVRRCIVVLDTDASSYPGDGGAEAFERAIEAAASLVSSADRAGLTTRFVCGPTPASTGGPNLDLRGPEVTGSTLRHLARVDVGPALGEIERDPGEGLGLVIVVTPSASTIAWRHTDALLDPTLVRLGVTVGQHDTGADEGAAPAASNVPTGRFWVDATDIGRFITGWEALTAARSTARDASRLAPSVVPA